MIKASVIVPTQISQPELLSLCLDSLVNQSFRSKKIEIIVVVNNPYQQFNFDQYIAGKTSQKIFFTVIQYDNSLGYAGAVNQGFAQASGQYLLVINDDAVADKDFITQMITTAQETQADMVAATVFLKDTQEVDSKGFTFAWRGKAEALNEKTTLTNQSDNWLQHQDLWGDSSLPSHFFQEPFGPDGAAALYSKKMIDHIGAFDSSFFAYLEDVELAFRARKHGHWCALSSAQVKHYKHQTSNKLGNSFKAKQDLINWWRIVLIHYQLIHWRKFGVRIFEERLRNISGYIKSLFYK